MIVGDALFGKRSMLTRCARVKQNGLRIGPTFSASGATPRADARHQGGRTYGHVVGAIWPGHRRRRAGPPTCRHSRAGGVLGIVRDEQNGLLISPGDPDALRAALQRLE